MLLDVCFVRETYLEVLFVVLFADWLVIVVGLVEVVVQVRVGLVVL